MDKRLDKIDEMVIGDAVNRYSDIFLSHALHPRNVGNLKGGNAYSAIPSHDGDIMEIWLRINDDVIEEASFWTEGCGNTIACGSMITEMAKGKTLSQSFEITPEDVDTELGGLEGNCTCAKLAVDTLKAALRDYLAYKREPWKRSYTGF